MGMPWYQKVAAGGVIVGSVFGGIHLARYLTGPKPGIPAGESVSDSFDTALAEGRLALAELNGDSTRELVYFPIRGPPAIFVKNGNAYTSDNDIVQSLYRSAVKFNSIISSNCGEFTKTGKLNELDGEVSPCLKSLVAYYALQDPSLALACNGRLFSGNAALPIFNDIYNVKQFTDLVTGGVSPSSIAGLVVFGAKLLQTFDPKLTAPPSYAKWTKSGPGWEDVGTVDSSGTMVKVSPGAWVNICDKESLKMYEDLRNDPDVFWTPGGYIRSECPIGESREDYYKRTDQEAARRTTADAQRIQLEQSVQQTYRQVSGEVQRWNQQLGEQSQQLRRDLGRQFDDWNRRLGQFQRH